MKGLFADLKVLTFLILLLTLSSCSTAVSDYSNTQPALDIRSYFNGPITAWGMVQDYQHKVTRRFCVELNGTWQGDDGILAETFYFDDGEVSYRNWSLTRIGPGEYTGTAADVIGTATGKQEGFALQWQYQLSLSIDNSLYNFSFNDWMYQIDDFRLFNRAEMKKLGITLAEITLFFDKSQPLKPCAKPVLPYE